MSILPVLPVADVAEAIEHYVSVFGFAEEFRVPNDDGVIVNGLVGRGDNRIMLNLNPKGADRNGGGICPVNVRFWLHAAMVTNTAPMSGLRSRSGHSL